jgi:hypothetical protein
MGWIESVGKEEQEAFGNKNCEFGKQTDGGAVQLQYVWSRPLSTGPDGSRDGGLWPSEIEK